MAFTFSIRVLIKTADVENAGTNGKVYLGIAGREYHLNTDPHDNFEQNSIDLFVLGDGSNLSRKDYQFTIEGLKHMMYFPHYIRLEPAANLADWAVELVAVEFQKTLCFGHDLRIYDGDTPYTWLGREHGLYIHLLQEPRYIDYFDNPLYPPTNLK
jgi:hypothetical protein